MLSEVFFAELELRAPDHHLGIDNTSLGSCLGDVLKKSEVVLADEKPDAVVILGDTNSSISAFIAERMGIPVYHLEAGNRSFDVNVPEELNRRMIDHVSTFNLPYTEHARRNLLAEGIHPRFILKTGSPMREVFEYYKEKIQASAVLTELGLSSGQFFLVSIHRQENVDHEPNLHRVIEVLERIRCEYELPLLVSLHPRTRLRLEEAGLPLAKDILWHEPFGYIDYSNLQLNSKCVISDSGSISEEASIMGFRAVTLRNSMERPEALEGGAITLTGLDSTNAVRAVEAVLNENQDSPGVDDYKDSNFSDRVLRFLVSTASQAGLWLNRTQG